MKSSLIVKDFSVQKAQDLSVTKPVRLLNHASPCLTFEISQLIKMRHGDYPSRRLLGKAQTGLHMLERGVALYHGVKSAYQTGSAIAAAAAPLMMAL